MSNNGSSPIEPNGQASRPEGSGQGPETGYDQYQQGYTNGAQSQPGHGSYTDNNAYGQNNYGQNAQQQSDYGQQSYSSWNQQNPGQQDNPNGTPNGYGYGQTQYGGVAQSAYTPGTVLPYASWGKRVVAAIIDWLVNLPAVIVTQIGSYIAYSGQTKHIEPDGSSYTTGHVNGLGVAILILGYLLSLGIFIWNQCLRQGRTGQTVGKKVMNISLLGEQTAEPIGPGRSFGRQIAHILDSIPCGLGYLWPIWDAKRQTFADKIMSTVVVEAPRTQK